MKRQIKVNSEFPLTGSGMNKFFDILLHQFPDKERSVQGILECTAEAAKNKNWEAFSIFCDTLWYEICTKNSSPIVAELKKNADNKNLGRLILNLLQTKESVVTQGLLMDYADALSTAHEQMTNTIALSSEPIITDLTIELMAVCHILHDTKRVEHIFKERFCAQLKSLCYTSEVAFMMCSAFKTSLVDLPPTHHSHNGISEERIRWYVDNLDVPLFGKNGHTHESVTNVMCSLANALMRQLPFSRIREGIKKM